MLTNYCVPQAIKIIHTINLFSHDIRKSLKVGAISFLSL